MLAAGLNPIDVAMAAGAFRDGPPPLPSVPGLEGVGLLDGRRVYFDATVAPHGSMAARAVVEPEPRDRAARRPRRGRRDRARDLRARRLAGAELAGRAAARRARARARRLRGRRAGRRAGRPPARRRGVVAAGRSAEGLALGRELGADAAVGPRGARRRAAGGAARGGRRPHRRRRRPALGRAGARRDARRVAGRADRAPRAGRGRGGHAAGRRAARVVARRPRAHGVRRPGRGPARGVRADGRATPRRGELRVLVERVPLDDVEAAWARQQAGPGRKLVLVP